MKVQRFPPQQPVIERVHVVLDQADVFEAVCYYLRLKGIMKTHSVTTQGEAPMIMKNMTHKYGGPIDYLDIWFRQQS